MERRAVERSTNKKSQFEMLLMNAIQKAIIAIAACLAIVVVFLHNPIYGYDVKEGYLFYPDGPCSEDQKASYRYDLAKAQKGAMSEEEIERSVSRCFNKDSRRYLPLVEWTSNEPHINWLGSVVNVLFSLATIAAMAAVVFLIFRSVEPADHS